MKKLGNNTSQVSEIMQKNKYKKRGYLIISYIGYRSLVYFVDLFILCLERLYYSYNWSMNVNTRMTNFVSTTKDENNALKITAEFRNMENPSLHWVVCKYVECNIIRSEPEFIQILFSDHLNLVVEMIEWMLMPKLIAKRKKIKSNLDFFPYRCKEFIKDNFSFYDSLYIFARNNKLPMTLWFNFLRKQFYDEETVLTALGYLGEVLIPFAKYGFSSSTNLTQSLQISSYESKNENASIMKILPKQLIEQIIDWCYHQPIYQFIKTAILVCIEDPSDYQICNSTMIKIFQKSQVTSLMTKFALINEKNQQDMYNKIQLLDHISQSVKQLIANIQPGSEIQIRIQQFISIILQSRIIPYSIGQILQSKLCKSNVKQNETKTVDLSSSQQLPTKNIDISKLFASQGKLPSGARNSLIDNSPADFSEYNEEQILQILLRILTYSVEIFIRIPKSLPFAQDTTNSTEQKQDRQSNYKQIIYQFHQQMQLVLDNLQKMIRLVYVQPQSGQTIPARIVPFSSGQKIKAISFMKLKFFKLIHNCLIMTQCCSQNFQQKFQKLSASDSKPHKGLRKMNSIVIPRFELRIQKLYILQIIQKYLNQNRWNNFVHHTLEKICHSLIICNYDYLRKNFQKDLNKKTDGSFLAFLIENFTQRHYIFLNTFKFTTQGNLQSLYNISKDLAYTLNSTNQLVIMLNEFEPWKKFIMNDLKVYEEKTYPIAIRPDDSDQLDETSYTNIAGLKVDQADSIRKLIQNISTVKKWPTKITKNKGQSRSGIIRNSDEKKQVSQQLQNLANSRQYYIKLKKQKAIEDFLKKKVEYKRKFEKDQQIQQLDVQGISVRQQLSKQLKQKQRTSQKKQSKVNSNIKTSDEHFQIFKNYSSADKKQSKL